MPLTPMITLRGVDASPSLEADILARIGKLETYYGAVREAFDAARRQRLHPRRTRRAAAAPSAAL